MKLEGVTPRGKPTTLEVKLQKKTVSLNNYKTKML